MGEGWGGVRGGCYQEKQKQVEKALAVAEVSYKIPYATQPVLSSERGNRRLSQLAGEKFVVTEATCDVDV